jgi:hypothetical protein
MAANLFHLTQRLLPPMAQRGWDGSSPLPPPTSNSQSRAWRCPMESGPR